MDRIKETRTPDRIKQNWQLPGHAPFIVVKTGDSLNSISHEIARNSIHVRGHDEAKAILIHNNTISDVAPLQLGQVLNVSDTRSDDFTRTIWANDSVRVYSGMQRLSPEVISLMHDAAPSVGPVASFAREVDGAGWISGEDVSSDAGFFVLGADSALAAGTEMLDQIQFLGRKVVEEATAKFGKEVMLSRSAAKLEMVQRYLQTNLNYLRLQTLISQLPRQLKSGLGKHLAPTPGIHAADARWARRIALVEEKGAARFYREAPALLEGKIIQLGRFAKGTTFVLPAAIGLYNVVRASPMERFKVSIEEAVGIGLGAWGTEIGVSAGEVMVAFLGLTGVGAFLLLFVAAGAGAYILSEFGKYQVRSLAGLFE